MSTMQQSMLLLLCLVALFGCIPQLSSTATVSAETYYVTPKSNTLCPEKSTPCFTLSQYAAKQITYFASNTTLTLLPGTHHLDSNFQIKDITNLAIITKNLGPSQNMKIVCTNSVAIQLESIGNIVVSRLNFLRCRLKVTSVQGFTFEECDYDGQRHYGTAMSLLHVKKANIVRSNFSSNSGVPIHDTQKLEQNIFVGGAIYASGSNISIKQSIFNGNIAQCGGAVCTWNSYVEIFNSAFHNNTATYSNPHSNTQYLNNTKSGFDDSDAVAYFFRYNNSMGGAVSCTGNKNNTHNIIHAQFTNNTALDDGGAVFVTVGNKIYINNSNFSYNTAGNAGALCIYGNSLAYINNTCFNHNKAHQFGGAITINGNVVAWINNTQCIHNRATISGGAFGIYYGANALIYNSQFIENSVWVTGGAVDINGGRQDQAHVISNTLFLQNKASAIGGALVVNSAYVTISNTKFIQNTAALGGAILVRSANFSSHGLFEIDKNIGFNYCVFYIINSTLLHDGNFTFSKNNGSLFASQSSFVTFVGNVQFTHNAPTNPPGALFQEGGAVTCFLSTITFTGSTYIAENEAIDGGGIIAVDSRINFHNDATFTHNTATQSGGAIFAYQTQVIFWARTNVSRNTAESKGGGMFLFSTTAKFRKGSVSFSRNGARQGGGVYLDTDAKLYIEKTQMECENTTELVCSNANPEKWLRLDFKNNFADYGGAIYISDETNSGTCTATIQSKQQIASGECFLQTPGLTTIITQSRSVTPSILHILNVYFTNNSARLAGGIMFGGLLDRCKVGPFSEISVKYPNEQFNGENYLLKVTNLEISDFKTQSIVSSEPVRICFCTDNQPNCSYIPKPTQIHKGETFNFSLVAVDHTNNTIPNTTVYGSLTSPQSGLKQGQSLQTTHTYCTELYFNVFSSKEDEELHLFAEGPCRDLGVSKKVIKIDFVSCPNGFVESSAQGCKCDPLLYPEYVLNCSVDTQTVLTKKNVWIAYINTTDHLGYVTYRYCPFAYCISRPVYVDMRIPNSENDQCAFNRSGKLCGSCDDGLSLSLGTSRCIPCSNNWLALLLVFAVAGVALVAFLLVCNLTVAVGTTNGLIFYANIVAANQAVFLPFDKPNVLTVFIAWLNLDFGFETCFYNGMDSYAETWLQLAFPAYTIFLVISVIAICTLSQRFARAISNKNPVATLATLILLSYTKLLRTIIAALSYATLEYSDGTNEVVWLVDGNVPYLKGKHIPLFLTALLIIVLGLVYTFVLFSWMWLLRCTKWRSFRCISNTKLKSFMDAYNAPYNARHRYWTGLLLLVRAILYVISALNISSDPTFNLLLIVCIVVGMLLLDKPMERIYNNWVLNGLESSFLFNLVIFTAGTLYLQNSQGNQIALTYTSTIIAFVTFFAILVFHTYAYICNRIKNRKDAQHDSDDSRPRAHAERQEISRFDELEATFDFTEEDDDAPLDITTDNGNHTSYGSDLNDTPRPHKPQTVTFSEVALH